MMDAGELRKKIVEDQGLDPSSSYDVWLKNLLSKVEFKYKSSYYIEIPPYVFVIYNSGDEMKDYKLTNILSQSVYDRLAEYVHKDYVTLIKSGKKKFKKVDDDVKVQVGPSSKLVVIDHNGDVRNEEET